MKVLANMLTSLTSGTTGSKIRRLNFESFLSGYKNNLSADRFDMTGVLGHMAPISEGKQDILDNENSILKSGTHPIEVNQKITVKEKLFFDQRQHASRFSEKGEAKHSLSNNSARTLTGIAITEFQSLGGGYGSVKNSKPAPSKTQTFPCLNVDKDNGFSKVRLLQSDFASNPIHVALHNAKNGLRVYARFYQEDVREQVELKQKAKALLEEYGITDADIEIEAIKPNFNESL